MFGSDYETPRLGSESVECILLPFRVVLFRRNRVKREAQDLNRKLQKEIDNLKKTMDELDNKTDLQVCPEIRKLWPLTVCYYVSTLLHKY